MPRLFSDDLPTISASEIGEYSYCSRAWWYRHVAKVPPPDRAANSRMESGVQAHRRHGRTVYAASALSKLGVMLLLLGALALAAALLLR